MKEAAALLIISVCILLLAFRVLPRLYARRKQGVSLLEVSTQSLMFLLIGGLILSLPRIFRLATITITNASSTAWNDWVFWSNTLFIVLVTAFLEVTTKGDVPPVPRKAIYSVNPKNNKIQRRFEGDLNPVSLPAHEVEERNAS